MMHSQERARMEDSLAKKQDRNEGKTAGQTWLPPVTWHNPAGFQAGFKAAGKLIFFKFQQQSGQQSGQELVGYAARFGTKVCLQEIFFFSKFKRHARPFFQQRDLHPHTHSFEASQSCYFISLSKEKIAKRVIKLLRIWLFNRYTIYLTAIAIHSINQIVKIFV